MSARMAKFVLGATSMASNETLNKLPQANEKRTSE